MKLAVRPIKTFYNRFSIEKLTKYTKRPNQSLPELIARFPGYGEKFKVFHKNWKKSFYEIEQLEYKDHRHCKILAIKYYKEFPQSKVVKMRNISKKGLWSFTVPNIEIKTDNGVPYNIDKFEKLIEIKKRLTKERNLMLGNTADYMKTKAKEDKIKKLADKTKKKK